MSELNRAVETSRLTACRQMWRRIGRLGLVLGLFGSVWSVSAGVSAQNLEPLTNVQQVAAGENHTCALLNSGEVYCWGSNQYGQLGYETALDFSLYATAVESQPCSLDIDGDGSINSTTDLILMARVIRGSTPNAIPTSVVGASATYQTPTEILSRLSACGVIYGP